MEGNAGGRNRGTSLEETETGIAVSDVSSIVQVRGTRGEKDTVSGALNTKQRQPLLIVYVHRY